MVQLMNKMCGKSTSSTDVLKFKVHVGVEIIYVDRLESPTRKCTLLVLKSFSQVLAEILEGNLTL